MAHVVVVGAGIVGLATAARLAADGHRVTVLDKERRVATHQTGRNSGVIHSGLYYAPGSLKATMAVAGSRSMVDFATRHRVDVRVTGKLVVASTDDEVDGLHRLAERGAANGVAARLVTASQARELEPHVACVEALRVEPTGIVDYVGVCRALADEVRAAGGEVLLGAGLVAAQEDTAGVRVRAAHGDGSGRLDLQADGLVSCAGLQADRVARACEVDPSARIVPFRGEYFALAPRAAALVQGLIYPVPDPRFPFLGVHLTRGVDGGVHAGPNAVLALAREGYTWRDVVPGDLVDALSWPGTWRMAAHNVVPGAREVLRSLSKKAFAASLARIVPGIREDDLLPAPAGVRAQAVERDGTLADDFVIQRTARQVHVLNAPSPAATAALEIARHIAAELAL
ncbi:L-2-hydroxyglutarate oxidase [Cellulomonas sp. NTE-D12]|uniref:L-2-hydroxyglutarate oxidase n=1 Tax=Cellulomonas sp. NTE-D12 TaxID=2962632 RepID=UPI00308219AD|nr:hydroxyglutarate oxidase [Cellulomonas sp. NTE-D12]